MNVLFITHGMGIGGASKSVAVLAKELKERGISPLVVVHKESLPAGDPTIIDLLEEYKIPYIINRFYWFESHNSSILGRLKSLIAYLSNIIWIAQLCWKLRKYKFDIVHSNGSVIDIGLWISKLKKAKHVWHLREYGDADFNLKPVFGKNFQEWLYGKCSYFIAISQGIKTHFAKIIPSKNIFLIYNGISDEYFHEKTYSEEKLCRFIIAGSVCTTKNQLLAVQAAAIVKKNGLSNFHLTIVGHVADISYLDRIKQAISRFKLEDNVRILSMKANIQELYHQAEVGLMLSNSEGFGRVTVEYMMSGLCVIASDAGANPEIITNNKTGLLFKPGSVEDLADKMEYLIKKPDERIMLAKAGQKEAMTSFLSSQNSKAVFELYRSII